MSDDLSLPSDFRHVRTDPQHRNDIDRGQFLKALDEADVNVSDWEAEFIGDLMDKLEFTPAQRDVIDKLMTRFPFV